MRGQRKKSTIVTIGEYSAMGFILPSCTVAGWLLGGFLDRQFGTRFLYMVFLLLGVVGGFLQLYRMLNAKGLTSQDTEPGPRA